MTATAQPLQPELPLAIDRAPAQLREHGLRETHAYPLASFGKRADGSFHRPKRLPVERAFDFPSVEWQRSASAISAVVLDLDGENATDRLLWETKWEIDPLPPPNWWTVRVAGEGRLGGLHGSWTLAAPVHFGETAREAPLQLLGRVAEFYAERLAADADYTRVLAHNPTALADSGLRTVWWRREPYTLDELAEAIPAGWRQPKLKRTGIGRNCDVFASAMAWAGSPANIGWPVLPFVLQLNDLRIDPPLDEAELIGIAKSVERYRRRWIARGRFYTPEELSERGRRNGLRSGEVRAALVAERDAELLASRRAGATYRELGARFDLSHVGAQKAVRRALAAESGNRTTPQARLF